MTSHVRRAAISATLAVCCSLSAFQSAYAGLGGAPMTPPADATVVSKNLGAASASSSSTSSQTVMRAASSGASATAATTAAYTERVTTLGNGTVVHEYLDASGAVFGIAWQGPQMPDMQDLLGSYFPQYVAAVQSARAARPGRGPIGVNTNGLVVYSGGHMGAFAGQAYLPASLPSGVSAADIQ
jgi:hypothetical protein